MGLKSKTGIALVIALTALIGLNALLTDAETKPAAVTASGRQILRLSNGDIQAVDRGPRHGSPIVLVHCFTCAIDWWDRMMPLLERDHRVVAIDLLGHGGSEKPADGYSITEQADLVADALERLGVRDAVVVGHSLGGTVATALGESSPELVNGVVIVDQAPVSDSFGAEMPFTAALTFMPVVGPALWRVIPDFAIEDGLGIAFAPGYEVPSEFIEDFRRLTYTSYDQSAEAEKAYTHDASLDERLRRTGIPVLAIFGAEERIYDPQEALAAYASLPGSKTALVARAGHSPNVERPAATAALVRNFAETIRTKISQGMKKGRPGGRP